MNALFMAAMYLLLAFSPGLIYICVRTRRRAWITFIVFMLIIDIVVILFIVRGKLG